MALVLTAFYSTFVGAMYAMNVLVMPRSGSDYVFVSRTLSPSLGLAFSLNLIFWIMMINAWNVYLTFAFVSQTMYSLGAMTGSMSLLSAWGAISESQLGILVVGLLLYGVCTALVIIGLRRFMQSFQRIVTVLFVISTVIVIVGAVIYTNQDFIMRFNTSFSPLSGSTDPYHDIINLATSLGYTQATGTDWNQTITVSVLWWLISLWPMSSAWIGGEVKQASSAKAQFLAMSGGQWFTDLACAFFILIWYKIFDKNWLAALGYVALNYPDKIPGWLAGAAPYWQVAWVNIWLGNPWIAGLVSISWILQAIILLPPLINACSRHLFAWSFDRVVPAKLCEVSDRWGSPIYAIAVIGIVTIIGYVFTVYTTYLNFAAGGPLGVLWSLVIVAIATLVFKWRRKAIFDASVASKAKLGGIHLHPIVGLLAVGTVLSMMYYYLGPLNSQILGGFAVLITEGSMAALAIGIVGYFVSKSIQAKRGIPLELVFRQIPPE
jgi:APA family basic amino acid/polyamine antiporter